MLSFADSNESLCTFEVILNAEVFDSGFLTESICCIFAKFGSSDCTSAYATTSAAMQYFTSMDTKILTNRLSLSLCAMSFQDVGDHGFPQLPILCSS